jgi:hypothetical protein
MAGFWAAVAYADLELEAPLSWGVIKGLLLRNLRYWSSQQDSLNGAGILTIGYNYPNQFLSENYNSPGSPYWFMLSFAALALPQTHPFWQAKEEPYPSRLPPVLALDHPKHIMVQSGGHAFLLSSGQMCHYPMRAAESKYGKFAYSSAFGYSVPTGGYFVEAIGGDNILALSDDDGESWKVRRKPLNARLDTIQGSPVLISQWQPWHNVSVETYLLPPNNDHPNWHLRIHHITSGDRQLKSSEGAFALHGVSSKDGRELQTFTTNSSEGRHEASQEAFAITRGGFVGIVELAQPSRQGKVLDEDANSNLMESRSILPSLAMDISPGADLWLETAVFAIPSSVPDYDRRHDEWARRPTIPGWLKNRMGL